MRWIGWCCAFWLTAAMVMIAYRWGAIHWFALSDTDDNVRFAQVRALLDGQGWFDLRQYKLDPPGGANIHWSRLVDLPIAAIILLVQPLFGTAIAERTAVAVAPMLPMLVAFLALALTARRLIAPPAFALAIGIVAMGESVTRMWMPTRIDHHGWQLALLAWVVAGLVDKRGARGGLTVGVATAASFTIGLEMLPYLGLAGAAIVLRWVWDRGEAARMAAYGVALAGGCALGFAVFASWDNRAAVCDALSPVYLSTFLVAGVLLIGLSRVPAEGRLARLGAAGVAGAVLAGGYALAWPGCLGRPEKLSPELIDLWFRNIREVKPITQHSWRQGVVTAALPVMGMIGSLWMLRRANRVVWAAPAAMGAAAFAMLFWQSRAGPAAQLLAVPGAAALGWSLLLPMARHRWMAVRAFVPPAGFAIVSGVAINLFLVAIPAPAQTSNGKKVATANRRCPTLPALAPIAKLPPATILTFVDMGPRLIAVTHHRALAGPYHRNGQAIIDIHRAFRSTDPAVALEVMRRHGATLILTCPGMSESTIYGARAKQGFYMQLQRHQLPPWLERVPLPDDSPFRLYRLVQPPVPSPRT